MNKIAERTVELQKGHVDVYEKNGITLYAYQTHDLIDDEVFVLADSDKFEKTALYRLAPMSTRFTLVTDSGLSEDLKALYKENGIRVAVKG